MLGLGCSSSFCVCKNTAKCAGLAVWLEMGRSARGASGTLDACRVHFGPFQSHLRFMHQLSWVVGCTALMLPFDVVSGQYEGNLVCPHNYSATLMNVKIEMIIMYV